MFLHADHSGRFEELVSLDGMNDRDVERKALFYILSGAEDLYLKVRKIYDFQDHSIIPGSLKGDVDLSSGARALVELAFNLYNSFGSPSVVDTFAPLDEDGRKLAFEAIKIRFRM